MKRRIFSGMLATVMALSLLAGCSSTPDEGGDTTTTTTTTEAATTTTAPTTSHITGDAAMYNRLTGEYDNAAGSESRAVAIMVANDKYKARPQVGLSQADVFVESETEAGITRMMAIFADGSRVPDQVAPVRSARTHFVKMAAALDVIYVHAGGSPHAGVLLSDLEKAGKIERLNALGNNGNAFWRDNDLRASRDYEHSLSTGGKGLTDRLAYRKFRTTSTVTPFTFGKAEEISGNTCNALTVKMSSTETSSFKYNAETGKYVKYFGKLSDNKPHLDTDGKGIEVSNVVVIYDEKYTESEECISFTLSSGNALLCAGGTVRNIQWSRTDSGFSFTENGKPASFLTGKTYICLVSDKLKNDTVIQ